jgi:hypothetical protein
VPVAIGVFAKGVISMLGLPKLKPLVAVAVALTIATTALTVQGQRPSAPEKNSEQSKPATSPTATTPNAAASNPAASHSLARKQLALIDEALAALHQLAKSGRISLADPSFSLWERRRLETLRKAGASKAELVAALERYIDILKKDEAIAEAMHERAQNTQVDIYDIQFRRMEAEIWLSEEKAR